MSLNIGKNLRWLKYLGGLCIEKRVGPGNVMAATEVQSKKNGEIKAEL